MFTEENLSNIQNHYPSKDRRKDEILIFLENNPGCTKEELFRGVNLSSKNTVQNLLKELKRKIKLQ
jgi:predicted transcriptional regulator